MNRCTCITKEGQNLARSRIKAAAVAKKKKKQHCTVRHNTAARYIDQNYFRAPAVGGEGGLGIVKLFSFCPYSTPCSGVSEKSHFILCPLGFSFYFQSEKLFDRYEFYLKFKHPGFP